MSKSHKVGRDAGTGKFMTVDEAKKKKGTAIVQTVKNREGKKKPKKQK